MRPTLEFSLIYAHGLLASASIGIVSFYYAQFSTEYALGPIAGNVIISMFSLCGAIGGVVAGSYLARTDLHRALRVGSGLLAGSSLGSLIAWGRPGFFALRVLASFGFIVVVTVVPIIFTRYDARRRVIGLALWGAYLPLGIALGNGMSALALHEWGMSWRNMLGAHGVVMILASVTLRVSARGVDRSDRHDLIAASLGSGGSGGSGGSVRSRLRQLSGASLAYAAGFGMFTAVFLVATGVLPRTLVEVGGLAPAEAGVTASLVIALGGLGSLTAIFVLPRIRNARLMFGVGFAGSALAAFGLYAMARSPSAVACFAVGIIVISSLIPATVFAYLPDIVDQREDVGTLNGLLTQAGCLGSLAGPPFLGWWVQRFSYSTGWVPFVAICAAGFGLFIPSLRRMPVRLNR